MATTKTKGIKLNSSRVYLEEFIREAAKSLPSTAVVLDAGAGSCPYKSLFAHAQYESADFCQANMQYAEINYICDLTNIPVEESRYDLVLCSQVIEHTPEPEAVLRELYRVLKPNGQLLLSAPLFYQEHGQPYDFYRYTQFGHRYLLEKVGFTVKTLEWLEGYYGTLAYQLETATFALSSNPKLYGGRLLGWMSAVIVILIKPLFKFLSKMFAVLDLRYKNITSGYCKNYVIIAHK